MSIKERVSGEVGRAMTFVERLRDRYLKMYAEALSAGNERLAEVAHLTDVLGPRVRSAVDHGIESMQQRLDRLNQTLAERAVPSDRKGKIERLKDKTAAAPKLRLIAEKTPAVQSASPVRSGKPAPKSPASKAPVTKAPVTKAPVTKAPVTKAPSSKAASNKTASNKAASGKTPTGKMPVSKTAARPASKPSVSGSKTKKPTKAKSD